LGEEAGVEMKRSFTLKVLVIVCVVALISGSLLGYSVSYLMAAHRIEALRVELNSALNTIASLEDETTRLEDKVTSLEAEEERLENEISSLEEKISALQITPEEYKKEILNIMDQVIPVLEDYADYLSDYADGKISESQCLTSFRTCYDNLVLLFTEATKLKIADGCEDAHTNLLKGMSYTLTSIDLGIEAVEKVNVNLLDVSSAYFNKGIDQMRYALKLLP